MADPVGSLKQIAELALRIKVAVETVRQNKKDCLRIGRRVERARLSLSLCENNAELMKESAASAALEAFGEILGEALMLVTACQERSFMCLCWRAGKLSKQLSKVDQNISSIHSDATFAILAIMFCIISKQNKDGAHPPLPSLERPLAPTPEPELCPLPPEPPRPPPAKPELWPPPLEPPKKEKPQPPPSKKEAPRPPPPKPELWPPPPEPPHLPLHEPKPELWPPSPDSGLPSESEPELCPPSPESEPELCPPPPEPEPELEPEPDPERIRKEEPRPPPPPPPPAPVICARIPPPRADHLPSSLADQAEERNLLPEIGRVALVIKEAVQTVRQNKEECIEIDKRVNRVSALLSRFENTETMKDPDMSAQLEKLLETFRHAHTLVTACQRRNITIISPAGRLSKQLREVLDQTELTLDEMVAISVRCAGTV